MADFDDEPLMIQEDLSDWVIARVDEWKEHYRQNYRDKHDEYYRIWRGIWAAEDKTRTSERSRIITPALQQAVESSVAEIEEATFGRGEWFDIKDDHTDEEGQDIQFLRKQLSEDFRLAKVRKEASNCLINSAVFGTGFGEIDLEEFLEQKPATQPVMDGQMEAYGIETRERPLVTLRSVQVHNAFWDPTATSIEEGLGCGTDMFVPKHKIIEGQESGLYADIDVGIAADDADIEADKLLSQSDQHKVRLTKYYGLVPRDLLEEELGTKTEGESHYVEAIVVLGNQKLLKAIENPYMMKDRNLLSFQWDVVPGRFLGRGVIEKGYNPQKALDAEIRARIDALSLTVHPMMAMDATRIPRGTKPEVRPGKILLTNGDPSSVLQPFNFGQVNQITFNQAAALQDMVQQATGAIDSAGLAGVVSGDAKAGAVSMSLGAIIKRHKRTLINFQDNFLMPFVYKAAWRYMQFAPEVYPVKDYKFIASSSLGIIAREYEVTQLVQLLQTMGQDSPLYNTLVQSIIDNMNLSNREELIAEIAKAAQPNPEEQQRAQEAHQEQMAFQKAQTAMVAEQAAESKARAFKLTEEAKVVPQELEVDKMKAISTNLHKGEEDDKEFDRRMRIADIRLKEKALEDKREERTQKMNEQQQVMQRIQGSNVQ